MKTISKLLPAMVFILGLLASCRAADPVAQQSGKDDVGYLLFVSSSNQKNANVQVTLDNGTSFTAVTVKSKKSGYKGTQYSVSTGRHQLTVTRDGSVLYKKNIMISPQEVKQINLP